MNQPFDIPHPLPDPLVELIAQRFRVLGEPMRIKLLDRLREGAATVEELQEATGALAAERLQAPRRAARRRASSAAQKEGNFVRYAIADEASSSSARRSAAGCAASSTSSTRSSREAPR